MTTERTQIHATFVIERGYEAPLAAVWAAFADADLKRQWFQNPDFVEHHIADDFRVGGVAVNSGRFGTEGALSEFRSTYTDIVDQQRIVYTYDMWFDGRHASTSLTTIIFEPADAGTLLTFTEQGVHLDCVHGPGPEAAAGREHGTRELLDAIEKVLARVGERS
jgi:uncharacterized protein YndB with AHSA1/START domain